MLNIYILCDNCGYRDDSERVSRDWLTVSRAEKDFHFCSSACLVSYFKGANVDE